MGPDRWRIEELGTKQLAAMGAEKDAARLCDFFADVLGAIPAHGTVVLGDAADLFGHFRHHLRGDHRHRR